MKKAYVLSSGGSGNLGVYTNAVAVQKAIHKLMDGLVYDKPWYSDASYSKVNGACKSGYGKLEIRMNGSTKLYITIQSFEINDLDI